MDAPDLRPMGPTGFFPPEDRAVFSGRAFVASTEFSSVASGAERYLSIEVDSDHYAVVWSISAGSVVGAVANNPGALKAYAGEISSGSAVTPINLLSNGPAAAGFSMESGDTLAGGAVPGDTNSFELNGQNILHGARGFAPGAKAALGIKNLATLSADISVTVLVAIFDKTTVEDVTL